jgi:hypothetical protein
MSGKGRSVAALQKVKTIFLHVVLKRTSLVLKSRNIQTNRIVCGVLLLTLPLMPLKAQSLYLKVHYPRVYGGSYQQPRRIL